MVLLLIFIALMPMSSPTQAAEPRPQIPPPSSRETFLKQEMTLAKDDDVYVLVAPQSQTLFLKAKGLLLKELKVSSANLDKLKIAEPSSHRLSKREPDFPVFMRSVQPEDAADLPASSSSQRLEERFVTLEDMPLHYLFYFEDGLILSVHAEPDCDCGGHVKRVQALKNTVVDFLWDARALIRNRRLPDFSLRLSEEHARAFFWSSSEGTWLLIDVNQ